MRTEQEIRKALELLNWASDLQSEANAPSIAVVYPLTGVDILSWILGDGTTAISSYLKTAAKIRADLLSNPSTFAQN